MFYYFPSQPSTCVQMCMNTQRDRNGTRAKYPISSFYGSLCSRIWTKNSCTSEQGIAHIAPTSGLLKEESISSKGEIQTYLWGWKWLKALLWKFLSFGPFIDSDRRQRQIQGHWITLWRVQRSTNQACFFQRAPKLTFRRPRSPKAKETCYHLPNFKTDSF